jgi:hypothetical protein
MDCRAAIVVSCWLAVAVIASVYMLVFGGIVGDVFFGVFLPVGLLVIVALAVTFRVLASVESEKKREG